jgi:hypothetical protein
MIRQYVNPSGIRGEWIIASTGEETGHLSAGCTKCIYCGLYRELWNEMDVCRARRRDGNAGQDQSVHLPLRDTSGSD